MGEIADMMIDGTMDFETGEFNFDGADGPGFPMTRHQAQRYARGATPHDPKVKSRRAAKGFRAPKSRSPFVCQVPLTVEQVAEIRELLADRPLLSKHFGRYLPKVGGQ